MSSRAHDAMLWQAVGDKVRCDLCAHRCTLGLGAWGVCNVRRNVGGQLKTFSYDNIVALNADPIEKKPLFHFLPGTTSLSLATAGCNFRCSFCQNWQISQLPRDDNPHSPRPGQAISPGEIVDLALARGCRSISYTYTEPTIFFELAYDTARLARRAGLRNCFVSNGFMTSRAIETIAPYLDAINVDLKAFRDETYRKVFSGRLAPVLLAMGELQRAGVWLEVTTLVVPGMNDSQAELRDIAEFIATELGPAVPWHVSRFHGDYKMAESCSTPVETLELARRLGAEAGLKYIYCGNAPGQAGEQTRCPGCGEVLIDRLGFAVKSISLRDGKCPECDLAIEGVWQ